MLHNTDLLKEQRKSKSMGVSLACLIGFTFFFALVNLFSIRDSSLPSKITAFCLDSAGKRLDVPLQLMKLSSGRYRIGVDELQNKELRIQLETDSAQFLMIRKGFDVRKKSSIESVRVSVSNGPTAELTDENFSYSKRLFIPLLQAQSRVELTIRPALGQNETLPLVIDEVGLYQKVPKALFSKTQAKLLSLLILGAIAIAALLIFKNLEEPLRPLFGAVFCFFFACAVHTSILSISCSPEYNRDLKVIFASGTLQEGPGCNLNYGLYMASSILQGKGPLIIDSPPWCRMPGYGYLLALAGPSSNLLKIAIKALALQSLFFAFCAAFFCWASSKIISIYASLLTAMIACFITFLPPSAYYLQIESIMPAVVLLVLAASCLFYDQMRTSKKVPLSYHILLHSSFALWFFMRTDILPAWGLVSLFLYAKRVSDWKYFLLPCALVLSIALPWGFFKWPYIHEFSMTTNSVGSSMMVGLWEIPHDFIWEISDGSFHNWASDLGLDPYSKSTSDFAVREVLRFWLTFPFYTLGLWFHKFLLFASGSGSIDCGSNWLKLYLLAAILLSFVLQHKRTQTFMLSFLVFFNAPIFFQFFSSSGRFYHAPSICLFAAVLGLLFDAEFQQKVMRNKTKVCAVIALAFLFTQIAPKVDALLIRNKALRNYSPFLDPAHSTLNIHKTME